jgi:methionyl-tRNA formyltransferase
MKIEFLTQDDSLYILPFFEEFLRSYSSEFQVARIACCRTMGKRSRLKLVRELVWIYGKMGFIRLALRLLKYRMLGMRKLKAPAAAFYSLKQLCEAYGIPYERIGNPNDPDYVETVLQGHSELIISVACPYILKGRLLSATPLGCINIHHAPLPKYRGMMPTFWQMYHGETKVGLTIHYMNERVDEGDALLQEELPIDFRESLDSLMRRSKRYGAHCMARVIRQLSSDAASRVKLDNDGGSYFTVPNREQALDFRRRGYRAI